MSTLSFAGESTHIIVTLQDKKKKPTCRNTPCSTVVNPSVPSSSFFPPAYHQTYAILHLDRGPHWVRALTGWVKKIGLKRV